MDRSNLLKKIPDTQYARVMDLLNKARIKHPQYPDHELLIWIMWDYFMQPTDAPSMTADPDYPYHKLTRQQCTELLNDASIQVYDHEELGLLRIAVRINVEDGTISKESLP
jgi:hypothetical protein